MKKDFMWYYTVLWLSFGTLSNFWDLLSLGMAESFWAVVIAVPTIIWLFKEEPKNETK